MLYLRIKRTMDVLLSIIAIVVLSPILLVVAIAIKLESKGPIIFKQERLGLKGKVFKIYKFRSMCVNAEKGGVYELKGDKRITKVGKFIRATSIDELPQLINIIKSDMSIIGPRPTLTYHPCKLEEYTNEQCKRFYVRPGITGWAQVNGRKGLSWDKRIGYDIEYVENLSFLFDVKIFLMTIVKVLIMKDNVNVGETIKIIPVAQVENKSEDNKSVVY